MTITNVKLIAEELSVTRQLEAYVNLGSMIEATFGEHLVSKEVEMGARGAMIPKFFKTVLKCPF